MKNSKNVSEEKRRKRENCLMDLLKQTIINTGENADLEEKQLNRNKNPHHEKVWIFYAKKV